MSFTAVIDRIRPDSAAEVRSVLEGAAESAGADRGDGGASAPIDRRFFLKGTTLVRVFAFATAPQDAVARLDADEPAADLDRRLAPLLAAAPEAPGSYAGRLAHRVQQRIVRPQRASLAALRYRVKPGSAKEIAEVFTGVVPQRQPRLSDGEGRSSGVLHGVAVFVSGGDMVRVVCFDGDLEDVARYMATRPGRPEIERRLAPYLEEDRESESPEDFLRTFSQIRMDPVGTRAAAP
ncbi:SchA/CurD-like domain-containing protein [Streptomonospora algeriensis]|uniref:SchA/CurD-like domain-containing protein n=1 Tax=Streptomonospora algeriensis TaxID=995084 RepID=A0ABW3BD45_9ACTN